MADKWYEMTSVNGYLLHEVGSAMQKEIRRGNPADAMYWASELLISGYDKYCWKRLLIILVEDIAVGQAGLYGDIYALYGIAMEGRKNRKEGRRDERENLALMAAVTVLAQAEKSRVNCTATDFYCNMPRVELLPIPDYALDRHTARGKRMGRGYAHFFEEGAAIEIDGKIVSDEPDPYRATVREWLENPEGTFRTPTGEPEPEENKDVGGSLF